MKICTKCKRDLRLDQFALRNRARNIYCSWCKDCQRKYSLAHYKQHTDKYIIKARKRNNQQVAHNTIIVNNFKSSGCCICGESNLCCLDLHHIDSTTKEFNVSRGKTLSITRFQSELAKCVVLCANCHRKLHAEVISL